MKHKVFSIYFFSFVIGCAGFGQASKTEIPKDTTFTVSITCKFHINPDKIAVSGCSAGGHLASLVGMTNGIPEFEGNTGNTGFSSSILFLNSGFPRFHSGQDEMIGLLKDYGIYYEFHKIDVAVHAFWLFHPWFETTVDYMVGFLGIVFDEG